MAATAAAATVAASETVNETATAPALTEKDNKIAELQQQLAEHQ